LIWKIEYDPRALDDLERLDRTVRREIVHYLDHRIAMAENPRNFGKPLRDDKFGLWRYRVRDYRIICRLQDTHLVVLVVQVGHRSTIYDY
jgi:mRNA interferase RelE/StbE